MTQLKDGFPKAPEEAMVAPKKPILIPQDWEKTGELSRIIDISKDNNLESYKSYSKLETLQNWIREQQKIYGTK